jgi:hypothetical protein
MTKKTQSEPQPFCCPTIAREATTAVVARC